VSKRRDRHDPNAVLRGFHALRVMIGLDPADGRGGGQTGGEKVYDVPVRAYRARYTRAVRTGRAGAQLAHASK
jgi:hypothetical protein